MSLNKNGFNYKIYSELFKSIENNNFKNIYEFNLKLENILMKNHLKFKRINKNIFFIDDSYLFLVFQIIDYKLILEIFKKYYLKYSIIILILNEKEYLKLKKIKQIEQLNGVKVFSIKDFFNIGLELILNKNK
ncbi:MAG: hypothetical protein ACTSPD_13185 [Promethearchaeota archaeon]